MLLVDEDVCEKHDCTVKEVADDLTNRIKNDENVTKIRETFFMMDELNSPENWIILKERQESNKTIRINIEALEYQEFGTFENCQEIAEEIEQSYFMYDGFVIV